MGHCEGGFGHGSCSLLRCVACVPADEIAADIVAVGRGQKRLTKKFAGSSQHKPKLGDCSVTQYVSAVSKQLELEVCARLPLAPC
jgi:hypothetical protein